MLVVHPEEVSADAQVAILRRSQQTPISAPGAIEAAVGHDVIAGNVLAACPQVESRLRIAPGVLYVALVLDDASPDLPQGAECVPAWIAQSGVGELGILQGIADEVEGEGAVARL